MEDTEEGIKEIKKMSKQLEDDEIIVVRYENMLSVKAMNNIRDSVGDIFEEDEDRIIVLEEGLDLEKESLRALKIMKEQIEEVVSRVKENE